jgi:alpha-glucuronidase
VLYGVFRFLKLIQTRQPLDALDISDAPKLKVRVLDHWDNLDRHVERGYAGQSIWDWQKLPLYKDPRYTDYARANASIGINGTVLNNVNANADVLPRMAGEGEGAGGRVPALWHQGLSERALLGADRAGRAQDRRSARPAGRRLVEGQGRRDLPRHPRFRRLPGQGQFGGPARPRRLQAHHAEGANMLADALRRMAAS